MFEKSYSLYSVQTETECSPQMAYKYLCLFGCIREVVARTLIFKTSDSGFYFSQQSRGSKILT